MMKRYLILSVVFLIGLSYLVLGAHTTTVSIGPDSLYETNLGEFYLFVGNNPGSVNSITNITLSYPGYTMTGVLNLPNWQYDGDINWYNGLISAFGSQTFVFNASAQLVNVDTPFTWTIITTDTAGATQTNTVTVTILNDSIVPSILNIWPEDYSFVRNETIDFYISVQELETTISPNYFNLGFDDNNPMQTSGSVKDNILMLDMGGNLFTGSLNTNDPSKIDLSFGSMFFDYKISGLSDAAGNQYAETGFSHHIYIDTEYPVMVLNQPQDNLITKQYLHNITFNMSDNSFETIGQGLFNPQVNCTAFIGPNMNGEVAYNNNVNDAGLIVDISNLSDGYYPFGVWCFDKAYYYSSSDIRTIVLDTTGPVITLDYPSNNSIIASGDSIYLSINDIYAGISSVWYNDGITDYNIYNGSGEPGAGVIIDTSLWDEGINNIVVYANDTLNNIGSLGLSFIVDMTPPFVDLVSPFDGDLTNGNVNFTFNAVDDFDNILDCDLYIDGGIVGSVSAQSGQDTIINPGPAPGDGNYGWFISCRDDANLYTDSETWFVEVDMTPPELLDITPFNLLNGTNDDDGLVNIDFNVIDNYGLSECELYINGVFDDVAGLANFNINLGMSNDPYLININCNDDVNNWYNLPQLILYYDKIAPNIFNVNSSGISSGGAIISWNTTEDATRNLTYWIIPNSSLSSSLIIYEREHSIPLSGLQGSTTYYYNVSSGDMWGNVNTTSGFSFTTLAAPASPGSPGGGGGGGSSSGGGRCNENWTCTEWNECGGLGVQTRECTDINECGEEYYKPGESQSCILSFVEKEIKEVSYEEEIKEEEEPVSVGAAVLNVIKSTPFKALIALIIIGLIIAAFMRFMRERPPKRINIADYRDDGDTPFSVE